MIAYSIAGLRALDACKINDRAASIRAHLGRDVPVSVCRVKCRRALNGAQGATMDTDLLELIRPALDEMIAAEPTLVWSVIATVRDSVAFEREDKLASIFWDGSARYRWMVAVADGEESHRGDTLADAVAASGILL